MKKIVQHTPSEKKPSLYEWFSRAYIFFVILASVGALTGLITDAYSKFVVILEDVKPAFISVVATLLGAALALLYRVLRSSVNRPIAIVFVSHATANRKVASMLVDELEKANIKCRLPHRELLVGDDISEKTKELIHSSDFYVPIFSSEAAQSSMFLEELGYAAEFNLPFLPVRLDDMPLPSRLDALVCLDMRREPTAAIHELIKAIIAKSSARLKTMTSR